MTRLEPEAALRNFLRYRLTDYNSGNRGGSQWVFDDWPRDDLSPESFPRVVVLKLGEGGRLIGLSDNDTFDELLFEIDVLVHRDLGVLTISHSNESLGVISNSPRLSFDYLAQSVSSIKHDGTAFSTLTPVVNDSDFSSPSAGTVEWSRSTGNLNFSSSDLSSYAGETITASYSELLEGDQLAKRVGRDIVVAIRSYWRIDSLLDGLFYPEKISGPRVVEFGVPEGWHRVIVEYRFRRLNTGEEV